MSWKWRSSSWLICDVIDEGIVAEMINFVSFSMKNKILSCFNESLRRDVFDESWKNTIFKILPKHDELQDTGNRRPIAILPVMYKLFVRLIYNRIAPLLLVNQSQEQYPFTPGVRIEDALLCAKCSIGYLLEFNVPL